MGHRFKTRVSALAVVLSCLPWLTAQHYSFQSFSEDQGLRNLSLACLLQDRTGFLWVGTQDGLFRFDGHHFTAFGRSQGLRDTMLYALHQTPDGSIWAGTQLGVYRSDGNDFVAAEANIPLNVRSPSGLASDQQGRLFVATTKGLVIGELSASGVRRFSYYRDPQLPPGEATPSVYVDPSNVVWFAAGARLYSLDTGHLTIYGTESGLPQDSWRSILSDGSGALWLRGERHLFVRRRGTPQFIAVEQGLPVETRSYLSPDGEGGVMLSSTKGLGHWDGLQWRFYDDSNGLPGKDVCCVLHDREGSRWVGLRGAGLVRWRNHREWESFSRADGLRAEEVWAIKRDLGGRVWVGTNAGVEMIRANPSGARVHFGDKKVTALASDLAGMLWAGFLPGGVMELDPSKGTSHQFGKESGLANEKVLSLFVDRSNRLWVGTVSGLFRADVLRGRVRFSRVSDLPESDNEMFHAFAQDALGVIWVAGSKGLARLEGSVWTRYSKKDGLIEDHVAGLSLPSADEIWVYYGQDPSVSRLHYTPHGLQAIEQFSVANGLHSGQVTFVGADRKGRMWIGGDQGVDQYFGGKWRYFGRAEGLVWNDCNSNAFLADPDGGVWMGTSKGLAHYLSPKWTQPTPPPPIVLTAAHWGPHALRSGRNPAFPYERYPLMITFAGLTFKNEAAVKFKYRLQGLEQEWTETDQREVPFPSLADGSYTFQVMARSAENVWSEQPAQVSLEIRPPFWRTWWAYGLLVCLLTWTGWRVWLWRVQHLIRRQIELQRTVDERTKELQNEKRDLLKAREELQELATRDSLTGLWNRRMIFEILAKELRDAQTNHHAVGVIMADLDGFKKVNDRYGHAVGDQVLKHAAATFQACLRHTDAVGRYGGEEILVVLPDCGGVAAATRAEELRRALAMGPVSVGGITLAITCSFGVNWTRGGVFDSQELVKDADSALYRAKEMGRNRVETATTTLGGQTYRVTPGSSS